MVDDRAVLRRAHRRELCVARAGDGVVPFTLVMPKAPAGGSFKDLPAVLFQRGPGVHDDLRRRELPAHHCICDSTVLRASRGCADLTAGDPVSVLARNLDK